MHTVLTKDFFKRDTLTVAKELLGKFLVLGDKSLIITEVEAYDGHDDLASHASKGKTARTEVMFGSAGRWYVYLIYGMYWMLNIVTGDEDYPAAILIRGAVELDKNNQVIKKYSGPGKLTKALRITKSLNNLMASKKSKLWIEDRGVKILPKQIKKSARIGVNYAGPIWAKKEYRFYLDI